MYINNINILYYLFLGIIGLGIGQFVAWSTVRLPDYKKVFVREFFTIYLKNEKPKYIYMVAMALLYVGVLYLYGFQIKTLAYLALIPMLISALAIDYRLKIIPNRLNLTIFEVGLVYTFVEGIVNINKSDVAGKINLNIPVKISTGRAISTVKPAYRTSYALVRYIAARPFAKTVSSSIDTQNNENFLKNIIEKIKEFFYT